MIYRFDDIEIDTDRFELRRGGVAGKVEPQVFSLIELLVTNHGRLVTKDELNLRIWGGRVVSDAVVNSRIRSARQALGDDGTAQRYIRTVHGRGFRFVGEPAVRNQIVAISDVEPKAALSDTVESGPSIAVLPFQSLAVDARYGMVADAVAHEVIVELSRLHWLTVIARGSSFRFRGPDVDLRQAGELLGARYFLTGSVAVDGGRSAVTVELSGAADGKVLWADLLEGPVDDLLALRRTIAVKVVGALEFRIPVLEANRAASMPAENLDTWSLYHRGLWHMYRFNAHDNQIAAQMFDRAIASDPKFARAHAGLSFTHFQNAFVGFANDVNAERDLARAHAEKSLDLDPLDPFSNLTMGRAAMLVGDMEGSLSWFARSVELNPNYAFAIYNRALVNAVVGAAGDAEQGAMRALTLSPLDPLRYAMLSTRAFAQIARGEYAEACRWADQAAMEPNAHVHIRAIAAFANELAGNRATAERWASGVRRAVPQYRRAKFFEAFPFRDPAVHAVIETALKRLGL